MFSFFGSCLNNKNSNLSRESKLDDDIITNDEYQDIKPNKKDQLMFIFIQNKAQEAEKYITDNSIFTKATTSSLSIKSDSFHFFKYSSLDNKHKRSDGSEFSSLTKSKISSVKRYLLDNVY
jgi:hypothetical protein